MADLENKIFEQEEFGNRLYSTWVNFNKAYCFTNMNILNKDYDEFKKYHSIILSLSTAEHRAKQKYYIKDKMSPIRNI